MCIKNLKIVYSNIHRDSVAAMFTQQFIRIVQKTEERSIKTGRTFFTSPVSYHCLFQTQCEFGHSCWDDDLVDAVAANLSMSLIISSIICKMLLNEGLSVGCARKHNFMSSYTLTGQLSGG